MTSDEALAIWKQSGRGKTYWTFEFAQAVERKTLDSIMTILDEYRLGKDYVAKRVRELSELPQPVAQTERDDELEALKADNASLLDSLTKESIARCELEDRLAQTERALTLPAEAVAWFEARQAFVEAVRVYNERVKLARSFELGSVSVDAEYQAMNAAQRKAGELIVPMYDAIASILTAAQPASGETE